MKFIDGGVTAPIGFKANGIHCGIRKNKTKKDLALIVSETLADTAAVYTTNLVKGAPLIVTKDNISDGKAQAIICNSGNANTCNPGGEQHATEMCALVEEYTGIKKENVVVASTGVIGQPLDITPIKDGMKKLVDGLDCNNGAYAAEAIMTTDTVQKEVAVTFTLGGKTCTIGGIAKGSGMINPNMATLLVFVTTDANIDGALLKEIVSEDVKTGFNMVCVDGDTSTNDMYVVMANGMANNPKITQKDSDYEVLCQALSLVSTKLCKMIASDGEGATKLLECNLSGASNVENARKAAKSVISSSLLKAAMFGADANWGRVLCALGYSGADISTDSATVSFVSEKGEILVCENGRGVEFSEEKAKEILLTKEIVIKVKLKDGTASAVAWGCDLTYDYVKINGDYRS